MFYALAFNRSHKRGLLVLLSLILLISSIKFFWKKLPPALPEKTSLPELQPEIEPIQVNQADSSQWEGLPGIGPVLSRRILRFREMRGGFSSLDDLKQVYGLKPDLLEKLQPVLRVDSPFPVSGPNPYHAAQKRKTRISTHLSSPPPKKKAELKVLDLNRADSAQLVQLPGIGQKLAPRIVRFRHYLGFYADVKLLRFVYGLSEENYLRMEPYLQVGSLEDFPKTDLNKAQWKDLIRMPFLEKEEVNKILSKRKDLKDFTSWEKLGMSGDTLKWMQAYFRLSEE